MPKIMVVGAGAIGNEVIKNLALLGIGTIYIVDMDTIEVKPKAIKAAERAIEINGEVKAIPIVGNFISSVGLGLLKDMDVVISGLSDWEARAAINRNCYLVNRPWIDGAIEVPYGIVRVFIPPNGPCYECAMNKQDFSEEVSTIPTTSSVVASIQVQEAIKLLNRHPDMPTLHGKGFFYNGLNHDSHIVNYRNKLDCTAHYRIEDLVILKGASVTTVTPRMLLQEARKLLGTESTLELNQVIVVQLRCHKCNCIRPIHKNFYSLNQQELVCFQCKVQCQPTFMNRITEDDSFIDMSLKDIGVPAWDIVAATNGLEIIYFELAGDREDYARLGEGKYKHM